MARIVDLKLRAVGVNGLVKLSKMLANSEQDATFRFRALNQQYKPTLMGKFLTTPSNNNTNNTTPSYNNTNNTTPSNNNTNNTTPNNNTNNTIPSNNNTNNTTPSNNNTNNTTKQQ